jgi:hypothetical protein
VQTGPDHHPGGARRPPRLREERYYLLPAEYEAGSLTRSPHLSGAGTGEAG